MEKTSRQFKSKIVIKLKQLLTEQRVFKNKNADDYLKELLSTLGQPTYKSSKEYGWYDVTLPDPFHVKQIDKVYIIDESIAHSFPAEHKDYVYTTYSVPEWKPQGGKHIIDVELFKKFAQVTGSIIIDGLKGTITARCGDLVANDITINFVLDVVSGRVEPTNEEYAKRILASKK